MKTLDDALELRRRLLGAFELAETAADDAERREWLTIALVGAGPTGVELAGQIRELAVRSLRSDFRSFVPNRSGCCCSTVARNRSPRLETSSRPRRHANSRPRRRTADGARVTDVDAFGVDVQTDGGTERIAARTVVWAAGVHASPLAAMLADGPVPRSTGPVVSRRFPTSPSPGIPRCSRSATW